MCQYSTAAVDGQVSARPAISSRETSSQSAMALTRCASSITPAMIFLFVVLPYKDGCGQFSRLLYAGGQPAQGVGFVGKDLNVVEVSDLGAGLQLPFVLGFDVPGALVQNG